MLVPNDDTGFLIRFTPTSDPKTTQNLMHFDLTSRSLDDQHQTVARALALGGGRCDVGQRDDEGHIVLADPEGNEFCVIEPGNAFLAECGFVGAVACDGSRAVGHFWSEALGWPLVWDQNEETAIRSPRGGPKITWGGRPIAPKVGEPRIHFELVPSADSDQQTEVARLVTLGATQLAHNDSRRSALADPDGNLFRVGAGDKPKIAQGGAMWRAKKT